ncbi:hypothetical protein E3U55_10305 [Filobacillus milosensis]|uniref:Lipoprotein n=1 Tax=Filobacillus milosensis TaxID=94137 RepID=A0A4Y8IIA7_9BACI|nr:hypothetical protein [Filobacillus milosensis]TFB19545.1 hypothetical protein E3U55_10305 [Filobacillus milosensis]
MKLQKIIILLISLITVVGCTNQTVDTIEDNQPTLNQETILGDINKEIEWREDLRLVKQKEICEQKQTHCFEDRRGFLIETQLNDQQDTFFNLIKEYELPEKGSYEKEGYSKHVFYENGYAFYKDTKMLYAAPNHDINSGNPTEDQYLGIVMMWIELYGSNSPTELENNENVLSIINGLQNIREYAQNEEVISWVDNSTSILQSLKDNDQTSEEDYLQAWKELSLLSNVVRVYRYELGN